MNDIFIPFILLYPEIHYRFKFFPFSRYFVKEPEILLDAPYKTLDPKIPVFIIVKDAHLYPVTIWSVKFHLLYSDGSYFVKTFVLNERISEQFYWKEFSFDSKDKKGFTRIGAQIQVFVNGKMKEILNSNLKGLQDDLDIFVSDNEELFEGFVQGDLHYHSNYSSDQVEFGAPIAATKECARKLGLDFFGVTDHSYDLDDDPYDYLKPDPDIKKFIQMQNECGEYSDEDVSIIQAQEVTVRNSKDRNVHILAYGDEYMQGSGDSAENWLHTRSENTIFDVVHKLKDNGLAIAAHPFNRTPLLQYLLVNRGSWSDDDVVTNHLYHIQILNGVYDDDFFRSLSRWVKILLSGKKIFITAGSDAHGNFNMFRQVKFPMFKLQKADKQLFGKCRTVVFSDSRSPEMIMKGIKNGNCYITDGPHVQFSVRNNSSVHHPGSSFVAESGDLEAEIFINSSDYSGHIKSIIVYRGSIHASDEKIVWQKEFKSDLNIFEVCVPLKADGIDHYIRLETFTSKVHSNGKTLSHRAYTNPVWINK